MHLKLTGSLLIVIGCGGYGILMAASHRREVHALHQLVAALDLMICELEYQLTPLPDLCRFAGSHSKGEIGKFWRKLADLLNEQYSPDVGVCTTTALKGISNMPSCASAQLQALGQTLGRFDLSGQMTALERCRQACLSHLGVLKHQQPQRLRSYQTLGFCAGAALAILLF